MSKYTITEVSTMLNVKVHTIRYWEKNVPLFSVRRDGSGKRVYEPQDVLALAQFNYFISKKKLSVKKAEQALLELFNDSNYNTKRGKYFSVLKKMDAQRLLFQEAQTLLGELRIRGRDSPRKLNASKQCSKKLLVKKILKTSIKQPAQQSKTIKHKESVKS